MRFTSFPVDFPLSGKFLETIPGETASTAIQSAAKQHLGPERPESPQFAGFFVDRSDT